MPDQYRRESGNEGGRESGWLGSGSPRGIGGTREGAWTDYSGRGPKGYRRSDERIREVVSDCLVDDHDVDAGPTSGAQTGRQPGKPGHPRTTNS